MGIREQQTVFQLWLQTFGIANRSFGTFLKAMLLLFVPLLLGIGMAIAIPMFTRATQMMAGIKVALVIFLLVLVLICILAPVLIARLYGAFIEERPESFLQSIFSSFLPTIFVIILACIQAVAVGVLLFFIISAHSFILFGIGLLFFLFLFIRTFYAFLAIALRDKGPISALVQSWEMTRGIGGFLRVLGMLVLMSLFNFFPQLLFSLLYKAIPLYVPQLNIGGLPIVLLVVIAIAAVFICLFFYACSLIYPVLVFINTEANSQLESTWGVIPQAKAHKKRASTTHASPDDENVKFDGEETIRLNAEQLQELTIESTAVVTGNEATKLHEQLQQVYQPNQVHKVTPGDEDRMPTILFDDDLSQQLEKDRKILDNSTEKDNKGSDDNGPQSVKLSK